MKIHKYCNKCNSVAHANELECPILEVNQISHQTGNNCSNNTFNNNQNENNRTNNDSQRNIFQRNHDQNRQKSLQCFKCQKFGHIAKNYRQGNFDFQNRPFFNTNFNQNRFKNNA